MGSGKRVPFQLHVGAARAANRRKGFTLLELMMVVVIIAILASIAMPQYIKATEKARATEALNLLGSIRSSELRYRAQNVAGNYTGTIGQLDIDAIPSSAWTAAVFNVTNDTGFVTFARNGGTYNGQTVGIQLTTGTICGTFTPVMNTTCVAD